MARIIEALPPRTVAGRSSKYPWAEWLDGSPRELVNGEDFEGEPDNFRRTIYSAASSRGLKVLTRSFPDSDNIALQANGKAEAQADKNEE